MNRIVILTVLTVGLSALSGTRSNIPTAPSDQITPICPDGVITCVQSDLPIDRTFLGHQLVEDNARRPPDSFETSIAAPQPDLVIYFDFDRVDVRSDYSATLRELGSFLADNGGANVRIARHADSRGFRRYNIELGWQRAQSVRHVLALHGAAADQLKVVSYGEESPAALGDDERSHSLNRRVEIWQKKFYRAFSCAQVGGHDGCAG